MSAQRGEVYKCDKCGIVLEIVHGGAGTIICCSEPMKQLVENTVDAAKEKHVPVITKEEGGVKVAVGSVPHPMTEEHYIEFIEVILPNGQCARQYLQPGQAPEATFCVAAEGIVAREYCNLHGLWKGE